MLWSSRGLVSRSYVQVLICYDAATGICMTQCLAHKTSARISKWPTQGVCAACTSFSYVPTVESFEDAALSVLCTGKRAAISREACCLKVWTVCLWTPNTLEGYPRLGKICLRMTMRSFHKRIKMFWYLDSMYCLQCYVFYDGSHFRYEFIHSRYEEEEY